jgi:hypothetical protein
MDFAGTLLAGYATSLVVVLLFVWSAARGARRDDEARGVGEPAQLDASRRELAAFRPAPFPRGERRMHARFSRY